MNRIMNMLCIGLTLFMLGGCASAKLNLELAIYKEDPFPCEPVTRQDIDDMLDTIKVIENEAGQVAMARISLAGDQFSIYW
jgi:hypothetical protein